MKILVCFGTRPEAIKVAPVLHELKKTQLEYKICVTAQHREMLDQVLNFFEIIPDYDLNIMKPGQSLNSLSSEVLAAFDAVLEKEQSDLVLVQGDTTTAFISALAAFNRKMKIGHIEAGLRTYNKSGPFPEEGNRQLISKIADYHFAPTQNSCSNLEKELIPKKQIFYTGNTVVDALEWGKRKLMTGVFNKEIEEISAFLDVSKKLILVTGHRRENFGRGLENIFRALSRMIKDEHLQIVFPVHPNPQVQKVAESLLSGRENIMLLPPVSYLTFLWLMDRCDLIISDSGGIQEEAPSFKKPVIVTRETSERMEGVNAGFSFLVGTDEDKLISTTLEILQNPPSFQYKSNPYGDGKASEAIVHILKSL